MHEVCSYFAPNRYSAKKMTKPINFVCVAPGAGRVCLAGDFNNWQPGMSPMERQPDGAWLLQILLHHGHHRYCFIVDDEAVLDPRAHGTARDADGRKVSLIAVS
jgi:1,4-alpha-glucan branching enzyme